ncbi:efflux RND transporter periplasmic adaptor subunit [Polymorphobacter fuscus]|uniref:Efflux RND transporter periplasmic adaptor subunit n=1 Tax=Sandarakinorhabdus fusca TaxID=1439888 RepID=A0A7C9GRU0_9SPHN|nr:efflux RND transporter periplasmic adaptor subunit [Polymorphobacter fuscus]KAB7646188.1 efflux RND transporter periplasmic adaptor subunit [Polymorphobacter fuscus]MQT17391.1 efflux RND transporter periplasmic adaptor subunit [Polymorphobacter fuscus]NJC10075.1 RND family efflux transporter MFP subunit [Polymorphobacter fuscus]
MAKVGVVSTVLLLAGCAASPQPAVIADERPVPVRLAAATSDSGEQRLAVSGTVRIKRETALAFNAAGRIAAIAVREGDPVRAGQVLARLDPTGLDASQASARAEAVRADADYRRLQTLFDKGWVTAPRLETARASAAAAAARVRQTGFDVGLAVIRAPSSGTVLRRPAEPGQIVSPGATVLIIGEANSGHVLRVPIADADLGRVRLGQLAAVTVPAVGPQPMAARVSEIGARGDDGSGTFRVEMALPARPGLKSGMIGKAVLRFGGIGPGVARGGVVMVPASAIFSARADEGFVYVHDSAAGQVRLRQVALGRVGDAGVQVTGGLRAGEQVVVSGPDRLRDGTRVAIAAAARARG